MGTKSSIPPPESQGANSLAEGFFDTATTLPPLMDPPYPKTNAIPTFSAMMGMEDRQVMNQLVISNPPQNSASHPHLLPQSSYYLHQQEAMLRALAAVNDASSSCPSQDTDHSTGRTTEISSMASARFGDFVHPSSGPVMDLDSIWDLK